MIPKKCSFILPTRNVEKYIVPLLDAIYAQEYDGEIEVLIQDSSDDKTPELAKKYPAKIIRVEPEDYNYGKTRNEGAGITDGEFLIFLSTDVDIKSNKWLQNLLTPFIDPLVAGVYGRQIPKPDASPMEKYFITYTYPDEKYIFSVEIKNLKRGMVFFSNTNSAIRRIVWDKIKIPEMLKGEDQEWAKRALQAGYKIVYNNEAYVFHSHHYSLKQVFHEYFDSGATMPVIYRDIAKYSMFDFIRDGFTYFYKEKKFMIDNGYTKWIPYSLAYAGAKFMGILLGSKHKYMPMLLKRALCKKKNHWDKYSDVIKEDALPQQEVA